jgi:hypothetical protein
MNKRDLFEHMQHVHVDRGPHDQFGVERGRQCAENKPENHHFNGGFFVALGESGPGNGHTRGRQDTDQEETHRPETIFFRAARKKQATGKIGQQGNQNEIDQLRRQLQSIVAPLENALNVQGDHHGVDHDKGDRE